MGVSTDAILVYGIPLQEDAFEPFDEDKDTEASNPLGFLAFMGDALDGINLVYHCSDSHTLYIAAIETSEIRAHRGHPMAVSLSTDPGWEKQVKRFVEANGLRDKTDGEPGWWLASYWG